MKGPAVPDPLNNDAVHAPAPIVAGRPAEEQLTTAYWLLALFKKQIAEHKATGAHADRIGGLREGKTTTEQRIVDLGGEVPE